jgi:hypothetical protein
MSGREIDPERLAAFFEGRLPEEERAEIMRRLAYSADDFDVFADAAFIRFNPFKPTLPATPRMFIGRKAEVQRLSRALRHTRVGEPRNFLVIGDRGFGKSSLLLFLRRLAEERFNYLVIDTDVDPGTSQTSLLRKITLGLEKSLAASEKARAFFTEVWAFARRVEVAGTSFREAEEVLDEVAIERFAYSLARTVDAITASERLLRAKYDGVMLLIDEVDSASDDLRLGSFLKLFLERLQRRGCTRLMVGVAGLPQMLHVLRNSHPAALRLFEIIYLQRLQDLESALIIEKALETGARENGRRTGITPGARLQLVHMADGIPHLVQQFAHSAFEVDEDWEINEDDVREGTYGMQGALATLGVRYGWSEAYATRRADCRWSVLEALSAADAEWQAVEVLGNQVGASNREIADAIRSLEETGLLARNESSAGIVRLTSDTLRSLIRLQAEAPEVES